ncbi:hypothetical protein MTX20_08785 [Bradyrhizobium sp. ISRA435]|nr:hypothetical protein MTX20_08785 [Bradyrhizobium sp. ISRA435]
MPPTNLLPRVASKPKRPKVHYAEFMRIVRLHAISAATLRAALVTAMAFPHH